MPPCQAMLSLTLGNRSLVHSANLNTLHIENGSSRQHLSRVLISMDHGASGASFSISLTMPWISSKKTHLILMQIVDHNFTNISKMIQTIRETS